jgi:Arc/MetJ-type ribon-helix-helix transcriptional regulator
MSDMKTSITIRLDERLERMLRDECSRSGHSRSEVVRDALRRQLAIRRFDALRERMLPVAEARGYLTDEDVFRDVS